MQSEKGFRMCSRVLYSTYNSSETCSIDYALQRRMSDRSGKLLACTCRFQRCRSFFRLSSGRLNNTGAIFVLPSPQTKGSEFRHPLETVSERKEFPRMGQSVYLFSRAEYFTHSTVPTP